MIEKEALAGRTPKESQAAYKARLRKVALGFPRMIVKKVVESIRTRAQAIFEADGGNIARG